MKPYDTLLIGSGHNSLVAAAYLAKKGRRVLVLEKKAHPGGIAVTEEFLPGFHASTVADGAGYLSPRIVRDLGLAGHGLEWLPSDVVAFCPQPDGGSLTIRTDTEKTAAEIARFSKKDAESYPKFLGLLGRIAAVVRELAGVVPPELPDLGLADLLKMRSLAGPVRRLGRKDVAHLLRVLPMPAADLLNEWFESDAVKGAIAANGVRDITWGPMEAGTAYTLLYKWGLSDPGPFRSTGQVRGGMGALTAALVRAVEASGGEIRTGAEVAEICVEGGRATGVRLASGEEIRAGTIVSGAGPGTTFLDLLDPAGLDSDFVRHVRNIKYRGSTALLHLALSGLPSFTALDGRDPRVSLGSAIQVSPSIAYLQRAFDCTKYGDFSDRPYLDLRIPTLSDPELAPSGKPSGSPYDGAQDRHVISITVKFAPYHLRPAAVNGGEPPSPPELWATRRVDLIETVLDTLAEFAPDLRGKILGHKLLTPVDLERDYGLPEGNLNHGEMTLDQFFHMRPIPGWADYRTPVAGLYLCGSGSHPGGGITGLPGRNAARKILSL